MKRHRKFVTVIWHSLNNTHTGVKIKDPLVLPLCLIQYSVSFLRHDESRPINKGSRFNDKAAFAEITGPVSLIYLELFRLRNEKKLIALANTNSHLPGWSVFPEPNFSTHYYFDKQTQLARVIFRGMKCSFTPGKWRVFIQIMGGVSLLAPSALHREVSSFTCIGCDNSNSIGVL
uniref:Uncharacterized protein n=1 Tax=Brassica oleracea var. oleracea TaxID=109376 RepID=A0A0D3DRS7_BRAOL